jgi:hypothetical protein
MTLKRFEIIFQVPGGLEAWQFDYASS